jgi:hypothetical protein
MWNTQLLCKQATCNGEKGEKKNVLLNIGGKICTALLSAAPGGDVGLKMFFCSHSQHFFYCFSFFSRESSQRTKSLLILSTSELAPADKVN